MDEQHSLIIVDNLLFQSALQNRELSQKKNEINQQIRVCRTDIAERKSYIETTKTNIKKLEEEMVQRQSTLKHIKANAKSMKATNSLLRQYEKTLKAELERRQEDSDQDVKVYEERITSYKKVFQQHKEHYCQNPLAKKLLTILTEKEEIECRIKACEDQITVKQKDLDNLVGQTTNSPPTENPPESISGQLTVTGPERPSDQQAEEEDIHSAIDISYLHLTHTKDVPKISREEITEDIHENMAQDPTPQEEGNHELWAQPESVDEVQSTYQMLDGDQDQGSGPDEQEERSTMQGRDEAVERMEERVTVDEGQAPFVTDEEDNERVAAFPQSSPARTHPQSSPARMKVVSSTPTFSLNSSPGSSPGQGTSGGKSPAFLFSMNPDPNTPSFSGFGFNIGASPQEEDSPFEFTSTYFSDKKSTESKSPSGPGFLFGQTERSEEDFQFSFASMGPETTVASQDKGSGDAFPFSFNFGKF